MPSQTEFRIQDARSAIIDCIHCYSNVYTTTNDLFQTNNEKRKRFSIWWWLQEKWNASAAIVVLRLLAPIHLCEFTSSSLVFFYSIIISVRYSFAVERFCCEIVWFKASGGEGAVRRSLRLASGAFGSTRIHNSRVLLQLRTTPRRMNVDVERGRNAKSFCLDIYFGYTYEHSGIEPIFSMHHTHTNTSISTLTSRCIF